MHFDFQIVTEKTRRNHALLNIMSFFNLCLKNNLKICVPNTENYNISIYIFHIIVYQFINLLY